LSLPQDGSSEEARSSVHNLLLEDDSFCGEGGRFGCPLADWFVLGGRWSGILREAILAQPYKDALEQEFPEFTKGYFPSSLPEQHKTRLDQLWHRFGGTGSNPLTRSNYANLGSDDDAIPLNHFLYDHFLKPFAGIDRYFGDDKLPDFADLDGDEVDETFIGRKWLVVVDYHN